MRAHFKHYIDQNDLIPQKARILLGISGGVDSMVLLNLFKECGYDFAVAHCNFGLRGDESEGDELFVRETASKLGVQLFVKKFNTSAYAKVNSISIQVAARNLRYNWFKELCDVNGFSSVAVAHNSNDVVETVFLNLVRGTGIKGLTGIKPKTHGVIRPLLFASRSEIEKYAQENCISFRTDSSNSNVKYARNRIRKKVIPEFEKINPSVISNVNNSALFITQAWTVVCEEVSNFRKKVRTQNGSEFKYSIELLKNYQHRLLFLAEDLIDFGFDSSAISDIEKSLFKHPGKVFNSPNYSLVRDRDYLILFPRETETETEVETIILIDEDFESIQYPVNLKFERFELNNKSEIPKSANIGVFDQKKLTFPLILRPWKKGDWFIPLGMKGRKKVSDFLTDQKIPIHKKNNIYVIENQGSIIWIVGYRIDDRFKVTLKTKKVWQCTLCETS